MLAAHAILSAGSSAQKEAMLPAIASGQQIFAFAYTEPDYGWGPGVVQLPATKKDGAYVLNGAKLFIPDANVCDQMIVVARTSEGTGEDGITMFVVDSNSPGVSVRVQTGWIGPKVCEVTFDNVEVPASNALGEIGGAWPAVEAARDRGTALISVFMAGGTQRVYDMAREYSQTRIAFGVPIGTFQRVQDHVIDALNDADSAKWSAFEALWQLDEGMDSAPVSVSMAKVHRQRRVPARLRRLPPRARRHRHRPRVRSHAVHQARTHTPALPGRRAVPQGAHGEATGALADNR